MCKAAMAVVWICGAGFSQTAFEVASVKPAAPVTGHQQYHMTVNSSPAGIEYLNASLVDLIHTAYRVNANQVQGPEWMKSEKFDVVAKLPAGASREQAPEMLQALLAERFKLAAHRATQVLPAYALVMRKGERAAALDGRGARQLDADAQAGRQHARGDPPNDHGGAGGPGFELPGIPGDR